MNGCLLQFFCYSYLWMILILFLWSFSALQHMLIIQNAFSSWGHSHCRKWVIEKDSFQCDNYVVVSILRIQFFIFSCCSSITICYWFYGSFFKFHNMHFWLNFCIINVNDSFHLSTQTLCLIHVWISHVSVASKIMCMFVYITLPWLSLWLTTFITSVS